MSGLIKATLIATSVILNAKDPVLLTAFLQGLGRSRQWPHSAEGDPYRHVHVCCLGQMGVRNFLRCAPCLSLSWLGRREQNHRHHHRINPSDNRLCSHRRPLLRASDGIEQMRPVQCFARCLVHSKTSKQNGSPCHGKVR